jgi:RNA polymerase sigma-70 factor, ECF subfamily
MSSSEAPDGWPVEAVRARDPDAVDGWYRAEHPRVWKLCLGFLADPAAAEEAAQDAMLHLFDRLDRWDPATPWAPWRDAVVLNHCRDRERRRATRRRAEERAAEAAAAGAGLPERLADPVREAQRGELEGLVAQALASLTPREREAFVLRELEGRPGSEVAEALGIGEGSVRTLLVLARRRLRALLAPRLGLSTTGDER